MEWKEMEWIGMEWKGKERNRKVWIINLNLSSS
jgi:hypothetical protein